MISLGNISLQFVKLDFISLQFLKLTFISLQFLSLYNSEHTRFKKRCTPREENPGNVLLTSRICLKYLYQCMYGKLTKIEDISREHLQQRFKVAKVRSSNLNIYKDNFPRLLKLKENKRKLSLDTH